MMRRIVSRVTPKLQHLEDQLKPSDLFSTPIRNNSTGRPPPQSGRVPPRPCLLENTLWALTQLQFLSYTAQNICHSGEIPQYTRTRTVVRNMRKMKHRSIAGNFLWLDFNRTKQQIPCYLHDPMCCLKASTFPKSETKAPKSCVQLAPWEPQRVKIIRSLSIIRPQRTIFMMVCDKGIGLYMLVCFLNLQHAIKGRLNWSDVV